MQTSAPRTDSWSAEQRRQIDELLDELLDLPESARLAALRRRQLTEPAVLAEVESLLRAAQASVNFLRAPAAAPSETLLEHDIPEGARIGPWRIVRLIGRGGMGEVYEALRAHADFEQRVAIKLLREDATAQLGRFHAERQILARLEHPGIARLYDGGIAPDGRPFMAMELVEGRPITQYCEEERLDLTGRLKLFLRVCEAVAYAHRNLVVHRDLKASNILIGPDGTVKLLDFGIAKLLDQNFLRTRTAFAPLTPVCASPEQLSGAPITTATDVYALGVLLFELMTGQHPWFQAGDSVLAALRAVLQRPAPLASRSAAAAATAPLPARQLRGDIDAVIAKALRADPQHRYTSVDALQADVGRVLEGEPVEARRGARFYVLGRMLRRYQWLAAGVAAVLVSLAVGLGVAAWQADRARTERDIARRDAAREEAVRDSLTKLFRSAIQDRGAGTTSAKDMLDASAQHLLREYRADPQLSGQIVLTLADLYGALEDPNGMAALLESFLAAQGARADPVVVADARQKLAGVALLEGDTAKARTLLDQADAYWRRAPQSGAEEQLEGLSIRARLLRMTGDLAGSIALSHRAIERRIALFGRDHRETALLYNSLAISLASASRLGEALEAYRQTLDIYRALGLADGLDAQIVLGNVGTLELRTGDVRSALTTLAGAIERERALAGDSAAVAAASGYYGKALLITHQVQAALTTLRGAVASAEHYAGAASPVAIQDRLYLAEAQSAAGDLSGARQTLSAAQAAAHFPPSGPVGLRLQLAAAQLALASGRATEAQTTLSPLIERLRTAGAAARFPLTQALPTLAEAEIRLSQPALAVKALREELTLLGSDVERDWELALARERLAEALPQSAADEAVSLLQSAVKGLEAQLGPSDPETLRARAALRSRQRPS